MLSSALQSDADSYCYSASICVADASRAIDLGFYSWATVKLYYSCFYALRGILALNGHGVFYFNEKPKLILAQAGQFFRKPTNLEGRGGTHGLIIKLFSSTLPNHFLLSQPIENIESLDWLKEKRENVNYGRAKYFEPEIPNWMKFIDRIGIRKSINMYIDDKINLYTFDPDHAILAFPIQSIRSLVGDMAARGRELVDDDVLFLSKKMVDEAGPIAKWASILRSS